MGSQPRLAVDPGESSSSSVVAVGCLADGSLWRVVRPFTASTAVPRERGTLPPYSLPLQTPEPQDRQPFVSYVPTANMGPSQVSSVPPVRNYCTKFANHAGVFLSARTADRETEVNGTTAGLCFQSVQPRVAVSAHAETAATASDQVMQSGVY